MQNFMTDPEQSFFGSESVIPSSRVFDPSFGNFLSELETKFISAAAFLPPALIV